MSHENSRGPRPQIATTNKPASLTPVACAVALLLFAGPSQASPLALAQVPAGNGGREPAPNLLISVDDSGSMGSTGIASLKTALNTAFSQAAVADDSIRLGFQAMWLCRGFLAAPYKGTSISYTCPDTRVKPFSDTHRTNFTTWVSKLAPASGTPSHSMMLNAHAHMSDLTYDIYRDDPASATSTAQACRKSFHIFMTDGGWKDLSNHQGATSINGTTISSANMGLPGNADGTAQTLPDGTVYDPYGTTATPTTPYTKIYRDSYDPVINDGRSDSVRANRGTVSTLADWAFMMWATDYRPSLDNKVRPIIRQAGAVDVGTSSTPYEIPEFWNPKNNPMTWQGLTTYTIGFNSAANMPTTRRSWKQYTGALSAESIETVTMPAWGGNTWTGDFAAMIRGDSGLSWPNPLRGHPRNTVTNSWTYEYDTSLQTDGANNTNGGGADYGKIYDLWHPAINGRGRYVPATSTAELTNAFAEIVNQVIADSSSPLSSVASNTQMITTGTRIYTAGYDAVKWNGYVQSRTLGTGYSVATSPEWDTAVVMDTITPSSRTILTQNDTAGTAFEWGNLSATQQAAIQGADSVTVGQNRVAYLRGDRSMEEASGGPFRTRAKRLGDIVNSNLWVVGKPDVGYAKDGYPAFRSAQSSRPTMIYVGANDGMLHGFAATDGSEKLAYVPKGVYNSLTAYTSPGYSHRYMVDGHPFSGDIKDGSTWKTMLVGTLAGGGKGYFVLDITSPSSWSASTASSTVVMDKTDGTDPDIGHMYSEPTLDAVNSARVVQITKLNNGRWALLMGNGVNSTDEKAVLLIQYLDGAKELQKIVLDGTGGNGNGLANPQVIDIDGNGTADVVYAGDQRGNLWKVDISSSVPSNWGSYYAAGATPDPLFVAKDTSGTRQPITTAPQWATHPVKGLMLSFGTGREMTLTDRTTSSNQTLYSVWDNSDFKPKATPMMSGGAVITNGRADLVGQTLSGTVTISGRVYGKTSTNNVVYTGTTPKRGWFMEWPNPGERTINNGGMLSDRLLYLRSRVPASGSQESATTETCTPTASAAREFYTVMDIITGKPAAKPVFDTDGGGFTGTEEAGVSRWEVGREDRLLIKTGRPGELMSISGRSKGGGGGSGGSTQCTGNDCSTGMSSNPNLVEIGWRQLQ